MPLRIDLFGRRILGGVREKIGEELRIQLVKARGITLRRIQITGVQVQCGA